VARGRRPIVVTDAPLALHDVAELAARSRDRHLAIFAVAGEWARTTPGPDRRWLARTAHEHAWHAQLWAARSPVVPGLEPSDVATDGLVDATRTRLDAADAAGRRSAVAALVAELADDLRATRMRVDADLDAPTARVLELVLADLDRQLAG
jgi:hypothetical protein